MVSGKDFTVIPSLVYAVGMTKVFEPFLNQAHAGRRPVRAWFLRIASVHECLHARVFVSVCVCVSTPEAINNWWHDVV